MTTCLRCFRCYAFFALAAGQFLTASLIMKQTFFFVCLISYLFWCVCPCAQVVWFATPKNWVVWVAGPFFVVFVAKTWGRGRFTWWAFHATEASRNTKTLGIKRLHHWQLPQIWSTSDWRTLFFFRILHIFLFFCDRICLLCVFLLWKNVNCIYVYIHILYCFCCLIAVDKGCWHDTIQVKDLFFSQLFLQFVFFGKQEFSSRFLAPWVSRENSWAIWYIHALWWILASILTHIFFKSPICLIHPMHKKNVKSTRNRSSPA